MPKKLINFSFSLTLLLCFECNRQTFVLKHHDTLENEETLAIETVVVLSASLHLKEMSFHPSKSKSEGEAFRSISSVLSSLSENDENKL